MELQFLLFIKYSMLKIKDIAKEVYIQSNFC